MLDTQRSCCVNSKTRVDSSFYQMSPRVSRRLSIGFDSTKPLNKRVFTTPEKSNTLSVYPFRCLQNGRRSSSPYCQTSSFDEKLTQDNYRNLINDSVKVDSFTHKNLTDNYNSKASESVSTSSSSSVASYLSAVASIPSSSASCASEIVTSTSVCKWDGCDSCLTIAQNNLLEHLQKVHVKPQVSSNCRKQYYCLWQDCRVYKQPSVSPDWLERHIIDHTDAKGKPFKCIFQLCSLRFSTTELLERHVRRTHITSNDESSALKKVKPDDSVQLGSVCEDNGKIISKRIYKRRRKQRCYRVRRVDFYDRRTQAIIHRRLVIPRMIKEDAMNSNAADTNFHLQIENNGLSSRLNLPSSLISYDKDIELSNSTKHNRDSTFFLDDKCDALSEVITERQNRIQQLLTIPHKYVGQRLSSKYGVEILVSWIGDFFVGQSPVTWIPEEEIRTAERLDALD